MSPIEDAPLRARYPLKQVKMVKKTIGAMLPFLILAVFIIPFLAIISGFAAAIGVMLLLLLAGVIFIYEWFYFRNYFYDMTGNGLVIRKGVISSWSITLPPHKVQDVYIDQDLLDRIFGLYDLHLSTATDVSQREAHIDGISQADAQALRALLLSWISKETAQRITETSGQALEAIKPEKAGLFSMVLSSVFVLFFVFILLLGPLGLIPFVVLAPFALLFSYLDFNVIRYELRREGVFIRTGFLMPRESLFLYRNIQDVEETRNLLDMLLGLRTLTVKTMTTASVANANLKFISEKNAQALRQKILDLRSQAPAIEPGPKTIAARAAAAQPKKTVAAPKKQWPELELPFRSNFVKATTYSYLLLFALYFAACIALLIFSLVFPPMFALLGMALLLAIGLVALALLSYIGALISNMAYSYAVLSDRIMIKYHFITLNKRELPFTKVQDIEKHVSFSNSFAKLATIKLETGAKEFISRGKSSYVGSASTFMESVPHMADADADTVRRLLTERMGLSMAGLGVDPLVRRYPLEKIKPLKKTLGWVGWFVAIFIAALLFLQSQPVLLAMIGVFGLITLTAKYVYELEYYKRYTYDMNDDVLVIKKGVFGSRQLTIPLAKIQDVFISRDIFDLIFGLYDVYVSTATSRSIMNAHIDGVNMQNAEALSLLLIGKIAEKK